MRMRHDSNRNLYDMSFDKLIDENDLGLYSMITNVQNATKVEILLYRPKVAINDLTNKYDDLVTLMNDYEGWEFSEKQEGITPDGGRFVWWDV